MAHVLLRDKLHTDTPRACEAASQHCLCWGGGCTRSSAKTGGGLQVHHVCRWCVTQPPPCPELVAPCDVPWCRVHSVSNGWRWVLGFRGAGLVGFSAACQGLLGSSSVVGTALLWLQQLASWVCAWAERYGLSSVVSFYCVLVCLFVCEGWRARACRTHVCTMESAAVCRQHSQSHIHVSCRVLPYYCYRWTCSAFVVSV